MSNPTLAGGSGPGTTVELTVSGQVSAISLCGQPMYWHHGAWQPYPEGDTITLAAPETGLSHDPPH
jgi:hypothetical protein